MFKNSCGIFHLFTSTSQKSEPSQTCVQTQIHYQSNVLNSKIFYVIKEVSSAHQAGIYLIQSTAKTVKILKYFYYLK